MMKCKISDLGRAAWPAPEDTGCRYTDEKPAPSQKTSPPLPNSSSGSPIIV